jgi:hypothetical protein
LKKLLKRNFTASELLLILVNLLPIWGVWKLGWSAYEVFMVYCLESVIIGLFVLIKLWIITLVRKKDDWNSTPDNSAPMSGYFFMVFFLIHYGFFIAIQLSVFLDILDAEEKYGIANAWDFLINFRRYLSINSEWLLAGLVLSYSFITLKDFVLNGAFRIIPMNAVMFEPYGRIFIQQFTVIIGGFFIGLGAGKIFITIFALTKIFFELIVDFKGVISTIGKKESLASGSAEQ